MLRLFEFKAEWDVLRIRAFPAWFGWSRSLPRERSRKERPPDQHSCSPAMRSSGPLHFLPCSGRQAARRAQRTNNNNIQRTESRSALPWPAIRALRSGQEPEPGEKERDRERKCYHSQSMNTSHRITGLSTSLPVLCCPLPVINKPNKQPKGPQQWHLLWEALITVGFGQGALALTKLFF